MELTEFDAAEYINTPERARAYLETAIDEDPGDGSDVRAALNTIARARNMSATARAAGLDRAGLIRTLSANGNPSVATLLKVTRALGLQLSVKTAENRRPS